MAPRESSGIRTELLSFSLCSFFLMYSVLPAYFVEEIGNEFWLAMMTFGKDGSDLFGVCLVKIELSSCIDKLDSVLSFVESLKEEELVVWLYWFLHHHWEDLWGHELLVYLMTLEDFSE